MGVEIPIGYGQANYTWTVAGDVEPMVVTLGWSPDAGETAASFASAMDTLWLTHASPAASVNNQYVIGPTTSYFRPTSDPPIATIVGASTAGTAAGATLPQNCAFLVQKRTAFGGRRNKGRMYIPPCWTIEGNVTAAGVIAAADVTAINTRLANFVTAVGASGRELVVLHSDGGPPTPITSLVMSNLVATQRQRLRR